MSTNQPPVPLASPRADLASVRDEVLAAITRVVDAGAYILGSGVLEFEHEIATRYGVAGAVGVGSGTDAIVLGLLGVGVKPGDEVITVSHTAGATVAAIHMIGAVPVLIDVDPSTYCLDARLLPGAIGPRSKAIVPVHLYGQPADLDAIDLFARRNGLFVVEDCAQAQESRFQGKPVGSVGDVGCFSFYPTKQLGAIGDGGLVVSSSAEVCERLRQLRTYGWREPQFARIPAGRCSRLDELQAAILRVKLKGLDQAVQRRRAIAHRYDEAFRDLPMTLPVERPRSVHTYHLYVVRTPDRDALAEHLHGHGVRTGVHYPFPAHLQPGLAEGARIPRPLEVTETIVREILSLPIFPSLAPEAQERVIVAVRGFFGRT